MTITDVDIALSALIVIGVAVIVMALVQDEHRRR